MAKALRCAALFACFAGCSSYVLQNYLAVSGSRVLLQLENQGDLMYTSAINISGQTMHLIMDSGSFECVAFRYRCQGCGSYSDKFFNPSKASDDFSLAGVIGTKRYGSGKVVSNASFATISLGDLPIVSKRQLFWLSGEIDLLLTMVGNFAGIFGLGPPQSAIKIVEEYLNADAYANDKEYHDGLVQTLELEKKETTFLGNLRSDVFSICILPGTGEGGNVIFNDQEAIDTVSTWVDVTKSGYWGTTIGSLKVGNQQINTSPSCEAVVDSGTSLLGVPSEVYNDLVVLVTELAIKYDGCDDLTKWPRLEFNLGGQAISLEPRSYVAKMDFAYFRESDDADFVSEQPAASDRTRAKGILDILMPHLAASSAMSGELAFDEDSSSSGECSASVFITLGAMTNAGSPCQFLLGVPIFREYYISHKVDAGSGKGDKMAFSRGNENCTGLAKGAEAESLSKVSPPVTVRPERIRFPSLVTRHLWESLA